MKKILFIYIMAIFLLASCDNRDTFIEDLNAKPFLEFLLVSGNSTNLEDSVKISVKSPKRYTEATLLITDHNNNLSGLTYEITQGTGKLIQDNQQVSGGMSFTEGMAEFRYEPLAAGTHRLSFTAEDAFGEKATTSLIVYAFDNLPPVAHLSLDARKVLGDLEYELNASRSYDRDENYGGGIALYTFKINEKIIETDKSRINYIFPARGNYNLSVTVKDVDGAEDTYSEVIGVD